MFDIQKGRGLMKQRKRAGILLMLVCLIITLALPVTANTAVKINKTSVSVLRGKTYNLKITGTKKKIKWTSSNKKIATVSASGKIKGINKGRCNIYAKVGKKKYTCKVTVKQPVTSIKLSKKSISLNKGKKYTLKASIAPKNAANKAVVWKSSNAKIASVSSKGVVTAKSAGTATITATAKDGSGKKSSCKVTIKGSSNSKILIQELKFDIKERIIVLLPDQYKDTSSKYWIFGGFYNEDYYYDPIIFPSNATNKTLSWKSSNTNVATVDTNGNITALRAGTTIISASTTDGSKKTISYKATVIGGKENFMEIDMSQKENLAKYLKRTSNRSYTEKLYDEWTGEKTEERKHYFLFENPLYSQGWRCVGISTDYGIIIGHEQGESLIGPKAPPYSITVTDPAEMDMEILQAKGKLVFYNIRGGDPLGEFYPTDKKIYLANPY